MTLNEAVSRDPEVMSGALCFSGSRVLVRTLFDYLSGGRSVDRFKQGFPGISPDQIKAVLDNSLAAIERKVPAVVVAGASVVRVPRARGRAVSVPTKI